MLLSKREKYLISLLNITRFVLQPSSNLSDSLQQRPRGADYCFQG